MSTLTAATEAHVLRLMRRKSRVALAVPALILAYLVYVFFAFDLGGLAQRARMDNARILLADMVSYKTHVTRDNRRGTLSVSIEGNNRATYSPDSIPDWILTDGEQTRILLGGGQVVTYDGPRVLFDIPDHGTARLNVGETIGLDLPSADWPASINASDSRVTITTDEGRLTVTRARTETLRYFWGWELFFFDLNSPFSGMSATQVIATVLAGERIQPDRSNLSLAISDFWNNGIWRHGEVLWAMFETVLMAFLGTFGAAFVALPLAFFWRRRTSRPRAGCALPCGGFWTSCAASMP